MNEEKRKYMDLTNGEQLELHVSYSLGGANYFSGSCEKRGYWLHCGPVKIERSEDGRITTRSFTMFSGIKLFLLEVKAKSAKRLAQAEELAKKQERKLVLAVLAKHGLTLKNPADLPAETEEPAPPSPSGKVEAQPLPPIRGMKMLTKEILDRLPALGATSEQEDPVAQVKFFDPTGSGTWFGIEYDPAGRIFHGYVTGLVEDEFGNFSLDELEQVKGAMGLGIERDLHFKPTPISQIRAKAEAR